MGTGNSIDDIANSVRDKVIDGFVDFYIRFVFDQEEIHPSHIQLAERFSELYQSGDVVSGREYALRKISQGSPLQKIYSQYLTQVGVKIIKK